MKKKAVIIGNMDPNLGVNQDIKVLEAFLQRREGGAWTNNEIEVLKDPSEDYLLNKIDRYKKEHFDYFLLIFGGHGDSIGNITNISPSHLSKYTLSENIFNEIADRQLSIFDCCRFPRRIIRESIASLSVEASFSEYFVQQLSPEEIRRIYEERIIDSPKHHLKLFSCKIGQYAQDDDGGLYTQTLISYSMEQVKGKERVRSAISVHKNIKDIVLRVSNNEQEPSYKGLLRVPEEQQFPFLINPRRFI